MLLDVPREYGAQTREHLLVIDRRRRSHEQFPANNLVLVAVVGETVQLLERPRFGGHRHSHGIHLLACRMRSMRRVYAASSHAPAPNHCASVPAPTCARYARRKSRVKTRHMVKVR